MEDTRRGIEKALSRDAGFAARFSEKINIPIFTSDELVAFARSYANELGYTIDEMGVLALYNSWIRRQPLQRSRILWTRQSPMQNGEDLRRRSVLSLPEDMTMTIMSSFMKKILDFKIKIKG